jgi:hypothetical protein
VTNNLLPTVSVIITSRNRPSWLLRAIESARHAGDGLEIIVVDDASDDATARTYKAIPGIVYVRLDVNRGTAGARNAGIAVSRGEFVTFLDDDDARLAGSIDAQIARLRAVPGAALVYGQALIGDESGQPGASLYPVQCPEGRVFWPLLERNFIPCGSVIVRRSWLARVGAMDASVPGVDDWDLWIRLASMAPVVAVHHPVMIWRQSTPTSGQGSSRPDRLVRTSARQLRSRWLKLPEAVAASPTRRRDAQREFARQAAGHLAVEGVVRMREGHWRQAIACLLTAVQLFPREVVRYASSSQAVRKLWFVRSSAHG